MEKHCRTGSTTGLVFNGLKNIVTKTWFAIFTCSRFVSLKDILMQSNAMTHASTSVTPVETAKTVQVTNKCNFFLQTDGS